MFVFKAGVVGAGTMGGEIAQLIAAAGIPVVIRDVEQRYVDVGLAKARQLTADRVDSLVAGGRPDIAAPSSGPALAEIPPG